MYMMTNYKKVKIQFRCQKLTSLLEENSLVVPGCDFGPPLLTKWWLKGSHDEALGQVFQKSKCGEVIPLGPVRLVL